MMGGDLIIAITVCNVAERCRTTVVGMTSSPPNVTSYPTISDQACYLLNSTSSDSAVTLSYNVVLGATVVFVVVGLAGNALSMVVFSSAPMRSFSSNVYLLTLAVSDSFYLIGSVTSHYHQRH